MVKISFSACCCYLKKQLHPSNCLGIAKFADAQSCPGLFRDASQFARREFCQLPKHQEFLELSEIEIEQLLKEDDLSVPNEKSVLEALVSWVSFSSFKFFRPQAIDIPGLTLNFTDL